MKFLKLKRINVLKFAFISALTYALISLILIPFMLVSMAIGGSGTAGVIGGGIAMIILLPVIYGIVGFIGGLIGGGLYNLISKWIGGLEFEVEEIEKFSN